MKRPLLVLSGAVLIVWLILPLVPMLIWSFARGWRFPDLLPQQWSLQAWEYALSDRSGVIESLGVTVLIAAAATLLSILVGVPAGRALGLYKFRGKGSSIDDPRPRHRARHRRRAWPAFVFIQLGLTNTLSGVILVHLIPTLPYMTLVMAGIFANYDPAFESQARSLGANAFQTFWHVTLPAIMPGIIVGGLFAFLVSWSQYVLTLLIGGGRVITLPLLLFNFASSGRNDITGAIGIIYILPAS